MGKYGGYETHEFIAEIYDIIYENRSQRDVEFFIEYSKDTRGHTLELGCGTGRVLVPTALSGCQISGLDYSQPMLEKCRLKIAKQPEQVQARVKLCRSDMVDFHTGEFYDLVTLPFRPFHHLISTEEQKSCLNHVSQHLLPHGLILLDLVNCFPPSMYDPKYWSELENQRDLKLTDGGTLRYSTRIADFHRNEQYNDMELIYYVSDSQGSTRRLVQAFRWRYFFRYEVEHLLELCGFRIINLFGNYDKSVFNNDSPEMIFVAEKK